MKKRLAGMLLIATGALATGGCEAREFERPLPNDYRLIKTNSYTVFIACPTNDVRFSHPSNARSGAAVASFVRDFEVSGDFVLGVTRSSPQSELADIESVGFFVLHTGTGEVVADMERGDFEALAKRHGIPDSVVKRVLK